MSRLSPIAQVFSQSLSYQRRGFDGVAIRFPGQYLWPEQTRPTISYQILYSIKRFNQEIRGHPSTLKPPSLLYDLKFAAYSVRVPPASEPTTFQTPQIIWIPSYFDQPRGAIFPASPIASIWWWKHPLAPGFP